MAIAPASVVLTSAVRPMLHISSSKSKERQDALTVTIDDCHYGIGVKIIGGSTEQANHGIFIKRILKDGKALTDGRLKVGDQLLHVNGVSLEGASYSESLQILRQSAASGKVILDVTRDNKSQKEFSRLMDDEVTSASEVSRATTPLNIMETSRSSEDTSRTIQSEPIPSASSTQMEIKHPVMNNSYVPSSAVSSPGNTFPRRQEIQRLANVFTHHQHANMASTPYDIIKSSNKPTSTLGVTSTLLPSTIQDNMYAQSLQSSMHPNAGQLLHQGALIPPDVKCGFEELEAALRFLGLNITEQQKAELQSHLDIDSNGMVVYSQFVRIAKHIFKQDLKQWDNSTIQTRPIIRHDRERINTHRTINPPLPIVTNHNGGLSEEIQQLQKENLSLRKQIHTLGRQLNEQVQLTSNAEKELHKFRSEAQAALDETMNLREKVLLATESQKIASQQEKEFAKIIEGLEQQIKKLKENESKQMENSKVRKTLAVMGSQLRKAEDSKRVYKVVTQKLFDFCQYVHDTMSGSQSSSQLTPERLADEALSVMSMARGLIEQDVLPFGWETCYNENGVRYYINHVTQETSWYHPITRQMQ